MPSPEALIEHGIGETRWALVEAGRIVEARIFREGVIPAGAVLEARLKSAGHNAVATVQKKEYLLPEGAPAVTEGAKLNIEVTREDLGGIEPWKRPLARATAKSPLEAAPSPGREAAPRELDDAGWPDLIEEARSGLISFPGGALRVSLTPAMTLIDVDGQLPPADLAIAGARAAALSIRRHGIGGSIGIDLPTARSRVARLSAAAAIDEFLPRPFERTAVNGFGFVQIIRPRRHSSLFEIGADRASFEARALLRQASREVGAVRLAGHPAVIEQISRHPQWLERLSRITGGQLTLRADPLLAISGGHVERA